MRFVRRVHEVAHTHLSYSPSSGDSGLGSSHMKKFPASAGWKRRGDKWERTSPIIPIMSYDKARVKQPFQAIPIPDETCTWIGKITITWSLIEARLDELIAALLKSTATEPPANLERLSFKKRKELCRELLIAEFGDHAAILAEARDILGLASDKHWRRNFVVHGKLNSSLKAVGANHEPLRIEVTLSTRSRHNGKETTLVFSGAAIETLFYEIGHVHGRLVQFVTPSAEIPGFSPDDKSRLRDFLVANHPNLPT